MTPREGVEPDEVAPLNPDAHPLREDALAAWEKKYVRQAILSNTHPSHFKKFLQGYIAGHADARASGRAASGPWPFALLALLREARAHVVNSATWVDDPDTSHYAGEPEATEPAKALLARMDAFLDSDAARVNKWQDAAGTIPARRSGDPVARWDDPSGDGVMFQADTSKRPHVAHPAATAREESIRAEVIEECARVCEEQRCRWCRDAGKTNPNHADCCACRDDAAAIRALALARSTGGGA